MSSLFLEYFLNLWHKRVIQARLYFPHPALKSEICPRIPGSLSWKRARSSGNVLITSRVLLLPDPLSGRYVHTPMWKCMEHTHTRTQIYTLFYFCIHFYLLKTMPLPHLNFQSNTTGFILFFSHSAVVILFPNSENLASVTVSIVTHLTNPFVYHSGLITIAAPSHAWCFFTLHGLQHPTLGFSCCVDTLIIPQADTGPWVITAHPVLLAWTAPPMACDPCVQDKKGKKKRKVSRKLYLVFAVMTLEPSVDETL